MNFNHLKKIWYRVFTLLFSKNACGPIFKLSKNAKYPLKKVPSSLQRCNPFLKIRLLSLFKIIRYWKLLCDFSRRTFPKLKIIKCRYFNRISLHVLWTVNSKISKHSNNLNEIKSAKVSLRTWILGWCLLMIYNLISIFF